jgi:sugar phosphate isomerase/epimerase
MRVPGRRRFLAQLLGAGLASTGAGLLRAGEPPPWKPRLSASSINFSRLPIEQACRRIADLGFEAVDIWSAHAGCPHLDDVQTRLGATGLRDLLDRTGLELCGFSVYAGGYARYAELLGAAGGGLAIQGSGGPCDPAELRPSIQAYLEELKPLLELAERHGSRLAIENHGSSLLDSVDSIRAFRDLNRSDRLGIALAPFHIQARGESVPDAIRAAGSSLLFFYAWQFDPAMSLNQLPGAGPADFHPWLQALAEVGYTGYVNPFLHDEPEPDEAARALGRATEYLRTCARRAGSPS